MHTFRTEWSAKLALAWVLILLVIVGAAIGLLFAALGIGNLLAMIPWDVWCSIGDAVTAISAGILVGTVIIGFVAILLPSVVWFIKLINWAFIFAWYRYTTEPHFPPKWEFHQSWKRYGPIIGKILLAVILVEAILFFSYALVLNLGWAGLFLAFALSAWTTFLVGYAFRD